MTVWLDVTVPALAVKAPEELAAGTVTETGMVREELLSESATVIPPEGAAADNVTVQVLDALGPRVVGAQVSGDPTAAAREMLALAEPLGQEAGWSRSDRWRWLSSALKVAEVAAGPP